MVLNEALKLLNISVEEFSSLSIDDIRKLRRKYAKKYHPDNYSSNRGNESKMAMYNDACDTLEKNIQNNHTSKYQRNWQKSYKKQDSYLNILESYLKNCNSNYSFLIPLDLYIKEIKYCIDKYKKITLINTSYQVFSEFNEDIKTSLINYIHEFCKLTKIKVKLDINGLSLFDVAIKLEEIYKIECIKKIKEETIKLKSNYDNIPDYILERFTNKLNELKFDLDFNRSLNNIKKDFIHDMNIYNKNLEKINMISLFIKKNSFLNQEEIQSALYNLHRANFYENTLIENNNIVISTIYEIFKLKIFAYLSNKGLNYEYNGRIMEFFCKIENTLNKCLNNNLLITKIPNEWFDNRLFIDEEYTEQFLMPKQILLDIPSFDKKMDIIEELLYGCHILFKYSNKLYSCDKEVNSYSECTNPLVTYNQYDLNEFLNSASVFSVKNTELNVYKIIGMIQNIKRRVTLTYSKTGGIKLSFTQGTMDIPLIEEYGVELFGEAKKEVIDEINNYLNSKYINSFIKKNKNIKR